jgi:hypothetical protein
MAKAERENVRPAEVGLASSPQTTAAENGLVVSAADIGVVPSLRAGASDGSPATTQAVQLPITVIGDPAVGKADETSRNGTPRHIEPAKDGTAAADGDDGSGGMALTEHGEAGDDRPKNWKAATSFMRVHDGRQTDIPPDEQAEVAEGLNNYFEKKKETLREHNPAALEEDDEHIFGRTHAELALQDGSSIKIRIVGNRDIDTNIRVTHVVDGLAREDSLYMWGAGRDAVTRMDMYRVHPGDFPAEEADLSHQGIQEMVAELHDANKIELDRIDEDTRNRKNKQPIGREELDGLKKLIDQAKPKTIDEVTMETYGTLHPDVVEVTVVDGAMLIDVVPGEPQAADADLQEGKDEGRETREAVEEEQVTWTRWSEFVASLPTEYSDEQLMAAMRKAISHAPIVSDRPDEEPKNVPGDFDIVTPTFNDNGEAAIGVAQNHIYVRTLDELERAHLLAQEIRFEDAANAGLSPAEVDAFRRRIEQSMAEYVPEMKEHEGDHVKAAESDLEKGEEVTHVFAIQFTRKEGSPIAVINPSVVIGVPMTRLKCAAAFAHSDSPSEDGDLLAIKELGFKDTKEVAERILVYNLTHDKKYLVPRMWVDMELPESIRERVPTVKLTDSVEDVFRDPSLADAVARLREISPDRIQTVDSLRKERAKLASDLGDIAYLKVYPQTANVPDEAETIEDLRYVEKRGLENITFGIIEANDEAAQLWTEVLTAVVSAADEKERKAIAEELQFIRETHDGRFKTKVDGLLEQLEQAGVDIRSLIHGENATTQDVPGQEASNADEQRNDRQRNTVADMVIASVGSLEELNAETAEEADEKFNKALRKVVQTARVKKEPVGRNGGQFLVQEVEGFPDVVFKRLRAGTYLYVQDGRTTDEYWEDIIKEHQLVESRFGRRFVPFNSFFVVDGTNFGDPNPASFSVLKDREYVMVQETKRGVEMWGNVGSKSYALSNVSPELKAEAIAFIQRYENMMHEDGLVLDEQIMVNESTGEIKIVDTNNLISFNRHLENAKEFYEAFFHTFDIDTQSIQTPDDIARMLVEKIPPLVSLRDATNAEIIQAIDSPLWLEAHEYLETNYSVDTYAAGAFSRMTSMLREFAPVGAHNQVIQGMMKQFGITEEELAAARLPEQESPAKGKQADTALPAEQNVFVLDIDREAHFAYRAAQVARHLETLGDKIPTEGIAVDLGCGQGEGAIALAQRGLATIGMDIDMPGRELAYAMIEAEKAGINARLVEGSSPFVTPADGELLLVHGDIKTDMHIQTGTVDVVTSFLTGAFDGINADPWRYIYFEGARILKPGGLMAVTTEHRNEIDNVKKFLERSGITNITVETVQPDAHTPYIFDRYLISGIKQEEIFNAEARTQLGEDDKAIKKAAETDKAFQNMQRGAFEAEDEARSPKERKAIRQEVLKLSQSVIEEGNEEQIAAAISLLDKYFSSWLQQDRSDKDFNYRLYGAALANLAHKGDAEQRIRILEQIHKGILAREKGRKTEIDRQILRGYFFYSREHDQATEARKIMDSFLLPLYQSHGFSEEDYQRISEAHATSLDQGFHTEENMTNVFEFDSIRTLDEAFPGASKTLYDRRGIKVFRRFTKERLEKMYRNLDKPGKRFFVGMAESDTGMMVVGRYKIEKLLSNIEKTRGIDYVDIWEISDPEIVAADQMPQDKVLTEAMVESTSEYGTLLGGFVLAHGSDHSVSFGLGWDSSIRGGFTDNLADVIKNSFVPETSLFFASCETANPGGIIEAFSRQIPTMTFYGGAGRGRETISYHDFPMKLKKSRSGGYTFEIPKRRRKRVAGFRNGTKIT